MKYYVAGPMTGLENYNWPAFEEAASLLRSRGNDVISPTEIDEEMGCVVVVRDPGVVGHGIVSVETTDTFDYETVLAKDLEAVKGCDGIYLLPGWESSKGANRELQQALRYGLIVTHHPDAVRYPDVAEIPGVPNQNAEHTTNPKDLIGDTKVQMHLVPPAAVVQMAGVMALGADKYGAYNWRENDVRATVYASAALRHLAAWQDGETLDPESGESHLAHVAACMAILLDAGANGNLVDDRPLPGPAASVLAR